MIFYVICAVYLYVMAWGWVEMADRMPCVSGFPCLPFTVKSLKVSAALSELHTKFSWPHYCWNIKQHICNYNCWHGKLVLRLLCSQTSILVTFFQTAFTENYFFQNYSALDDNCRYVGTLCICPDAYQQLQLYHRGTHMLVVHNNRCHTHTLQKCHRCGVLVSTFVTFFVYSEYFRLLLFSPLAVRSQCRNFVCLQAVSARNHFTLKMCY